MDKRSKYLDVTLIRSSISENPTIRRHISNLGLKKIGLTKRHNDNDAIRGLINKVIQYVKVEQIF